MSHLDMELTERCNNNCIHCYINRPADDLSARETELTTHELKYILGEAASLGCLSVCFTGGEPLLRDDFDEIYLVARRLGLKVLICTNATLITKDRARLFSRVPPLAKIDVSVYGIDEESYEMVSRVPGSSAAFRRGINLLLEYRVPFVARAAFPSGDAETCTRFDLWSTTLPGMESPDASVLSLYLRCRGDDQGRNATISRLRLTPQQLLAIESRHLQEYGLWLRSFCARFCRVQGDRLFGCGAGKGKASVDPYGNLQPCLLLRHPETIYDLRKGTIRDALDSFFPTVREKRAVDPVYLERCARCFLRSLCEQCPAISWMENRRPDGWMKYFCEFTHAQARLIGLLRDGEVSWEVPDWGERVGRLSADVAREISMVIIGRNSPECSRPLNKARVS